MIDLTHLNPLNIWQRDTMPRVALDPPQWCVCNQHWYPRSAVGHQRRCLGCDFNPAGNEQPSYQINHQGYRCKEFEAIDHDAFKIVTLGCTHTFGMGVPLQHTFGEQMATALRQQFDIAVEVINLGTVEQSIDFITRVLYQSMPVLRPHYVFCLLPEMSRREYIVLDRHIVTEPFNVETSNNEALLALQTPVWDFFSMVKNVAMIELILRDHCWSWDTWMGVEWKLPGFEDYFDLTHYRNQLISIPDVGLGIAYHTAIADDLLTDPHLLRAIDRYK